MSNVLRCDRCGSRYRGRGEWNGVFAAGVLAGVLCPRCQTPEENAEAVINESTIDYSQNYVDAFGRIRHREARGGAW